MYSDLLNVYEAASLVRPEPLKTAAREDTEMLAELHKNTPEETREQRVTLGLWLRSLREEQGLSQRDLADILSLDYYTFISQLENGRGKIPTHRYVEWANALGQNPQDFVRMLLKHYEPMTYRILFEDEAS